MPRVAQPLELLAQVGEPQRTVTPPRATTTTDSPPSARARSTDARQHPLMPAVHAVEPTGGDDARARRRARVRHVADHPHGAAARRP